MKKLNFWSLLIVFVLSISTYAQTNMELFVKANELYRNDKIEEALVLYETIEKNGAVSSELYYNLGNAYYKLNKVAPSIYNYEKALQLNPLNEDAKANLILANRMAIDTFEVLPKTVFQKLYENIIQQLTYNQWAVIAVTTAILGVLFFLFFYFSYTPSKRRTYFIITVLSGVIMLFGLVFSFKEYNVSKTTIEAIVFDMKTSVKNAPTQNSEVVFDLHEGTKVLVLDKVDIWKKIKLSDGKIGWVSKTAIKEL